MELRTEQKSRSAKALVLVLFFELTAPCAAQDENMVLGGSLGVGSDYTFRGISQTMGGHAIQASVDLSLSSGIYAYAWGSNIDFVPDGEPDDGASHEVDLAVGFATDLSKDWSVDLAMMRYVFPGTLADVDYDYNELMATLCFMDQYSATVAFSGSVDGTGSDSLFYQFGASFPLPADTTLAINFAHHDLKRAYGAAYSYVETTLDRRIGNGSIRLAHIYTQRSAGLIFDRRITGPRFVVSFQIEW